MYYLVLFYHALKKPLTPYKPLLKFLVVKLTLFFTFWQRVVMSVFQDEILLGFDKNVKNFDGEEILSTVQNTLICCEMLILSVASLYAFSSSEFSEGENRQFSLYNTIKSSFQNFMKDYRLIKPKKFGFKNFVTVYKTDTPKRLSGYEKEVEIEMFDRNALEESLLKMNK